MRPIGLLTDFGLDDPYVGQLRGVLAKLAPGAPVIDITHRIRPYQVGQAAFFLSVSASHFPSDTVFVNVVDPAVGSGRRILLARLDSQLFLAPDNGLLGLILAGRDYDIFDVTQSGIAASATFHGRDLFAPLAAWLSGGEPPDSVGTALEPDDMVRLEAATPVTLGTDAPAEISAHVLHVDRFGNVILNLRPGPLYEELADSESEPGTGRPRTPRVVRTYADLKGHEVGLLAGSQGFLELAVNQGSAARSLGCGVGQTVMFSIGDTK